MLSTSVHRPVGLAVAGLFLALLIASSASFAAFVVFALAVDLGARLTMGTGAILLGCAGLALFGLSVGWRVGAVSLGMLRGTTSDPTRVRRAAIGELIFGAVALGLSLPVIATFPGSDPTEYAWMFVHAACHASVVGHGLALLASCRARRSG